MEIEKMQFDKLKSSLENESSASDIGKEQIMQQLEQRLREANEAYLNMNDLMQEGPVRNFDINKIRPMNNRKEREDRVYEL